MAKNIGRSHQFNQLTRLPHGCSNLGIAYERFFAKPKRGPRSLAAPRQAAVGAGGALIGIANGSHRHRPVETTRAASALPTTLAAAESGSAVGSEPGARRLQKGQLFGARHPPQGSIAVGEAPELGDHIPVPDGEVGRSGVNELPEQRQGCLLHRQILAVHQWHQPKLPPRLLGFGLHPTPLQRLLAQRQGLPITGKGHGRLPPELAGELIEQQHQRQPALGGFAPAAQLAGDGLAGEAQESLPQQRISCR